MAAGGGPVSFYIVNPKADRYNPETDTYRIWNHRLGGFAIDYDAEYNPSEFGYTSFNYAAKRMRDIQRTYPELPPLVILNRYALFSLIGVKDWAGYP